METLYTINIILTLVWITVTLRSSHLEKKKLKEIIESRVDLHNDNLKIMKPLADQVTELRKQNRLLVDAINSRTRQAIWRLLL